jgi:hypothetical protein
MSSFSSSNSATLIPDILSICLESLEEVKKAYSEAQQLQNRVVELEKVASEHTTVTATIDADLVNQTVRNLVASSFLNAEYSEKLASEIQRDPAIALRLVQRFIEISTPAFSEGQGVEKLASEETKQDDPDGWSRLISQGA